MRNKSLVLSVVTLALTAGCAATGPWHPDAATQNSTTTPSVVAPGPAAAAPTSTEVLPATKLGAGATVTDTSGPAHVVQDSGLNGTKSITVNLPKAAQYALDAIVHRWTQADITEYRVVLHPQSGGPDVSVTCSQKPTAVSSATFSHLQAGQNYQISVQAWGNNGGLTASAINQINTQFISSQLISLQPILPGVDYNDSTSVNFPSIRLDDVAVDPQAAVSIGSAQTGGYFQSGGTPTGAPGAGGTGGTGGTGGLTAVVSDFTGGTDAWTAAQSGGATYPVYQVFDQGDAAMSAFDNDPSLGFNFVAPAKFGGDKSGYSSLSFDLWTPSGYNPGAVHDSVVTITNANGDRITQPGLNSTVGVRAAGHLSFAFNSTLWQFNGVVAQPATQAQISSVLSNIASLKIYGNYTFNGSDVRLDNVSLNP